MPGKGGNFCSFLNGRVQKKLVPGTNYTITWHYEGLFGSSRRDDRSLGVLSLCSDSYLARHIRVA